VDIIKQLEKQAEQYEVLRTRNEETSVVYEANKLKTSTVAETSGIAVRVMSKGKLGFAASTDGAAVDKLVSNALESASFGEEVPLTFPRQQSANPVKTYDPVVANLPISRLVDMGKEILDLVLTAEPDVRCSVYLSRSIQSDSICNQTGLDISFQRSPLSIVVEVDRIVGDDILIMYDGQATTVWEDDYLTFVRNLLDKLRLAHKVVPTQGGNMPVLFSPYGTLALTIPLNEGVNGKNVYKGTSPMKGKVGEYLFDAKISLVDDGTLDGKFSSAPYDDEGVPRRRNVLVERGKLNGFLYDLKTAAQYGVESTGSASRSLFNVPQPAATNFIIQPGETGLKDMMKGLDEGIMVESLLGLGQGNVISGAFSNPLSLAFKIVKGEVVGRVKNLSISGNVYSLLKNVAAVSKEAQWVYGTFYAPYVLIPEMNVVG
jgi:PmbA protein